MCLIEYLLWEQEVGGSNPLAPTNIFKIQEPFPHHAAEHGKSEWDSGTP